MMIRWGMMMVDMQSSTSVAVKAAHVIIVVDYGRFYAFLATANILFLFAKTAVRRQ